MRFLDTSSEPALLPLLELLRQMTRTENSKEMLNAFFARYSRVRPVSHYVGVYPEEGGQFRVMYDVSAEEIASGLATTTRDLSPAVLKKLPLRSGGFLASLMADGLPKVALDINVVGDPVLGDRVAAMKSCTALPLFSGDRIGEWTFAFGKSTEGFSPVHLSQATMTANLITIANRHLDSLAQIRRLNAQLADQFEQIGKLQQALLPREIPSIPGLEIATSYLTSDQAGGDYYDFFELPGGRWGILIADVSGHGPAAATVMAMLHAILHSYGSLRSLSSITPGDVLGFANRRLFAAGLDGSFVTALFGIFDPATSELAYASCGHCPPRLLRAADGKVHSIEEAATVPLGILDSIDVEVARVRLAPGDSLVLYTDGITELFADPDAPRQQQRELFGMARLDEAIARTDGRPDAVVDAVHAALFRFRGEATRDDDQTLLVIRNHGVCVLPG